MANGGKPPALQSATPNYPLSDLTTSQPTYTNPTTSSTKRTRAKELQTEDVWNAEQGRELLEKTSMIIVGDELSREALTMALFHIAQQFKEIKKPSQT